MDKKLKMKWVKALESGRYPQAKDALYVPSVGYCCLGVLCRKLGKSRNVIEDMPDLSSVSLGGLLPKGAQGTLIKMNDREGKSFPEIAAWIREHL